MSKKFLKNILTRDAVSKEHGLYLYNIRKKNIIIKTLQLSFLIITIILWETLAHKEVINSFLMSQPSKIYNMFVEMLISGEIYHHIKITLIENLIGFLSGTLIGMLIAIMLWWSNFLYKLCEPYLIILNSIPKVALGPVLIVWLGNGPISIIMMALLVSVIVTIIMLSNGFHEVENNKVKLLRTLGANKRQILFKVILPASVPIIFSTIKISIGLSLVGTIVGEFLVSKAGLGYLIVYGGQIFNLHMVMLSIIILCIIAGSMYYIIVLLEKFIVHWKH